MTQRLGLVCALVLAALAGPVSAQTNQAYFYCQLAKKPYGDPSFYSSVFRAERGIYPPAMQNAFDGHISARHDPDAMSGTICFGPFESYREAMEDKEDSMARSQRAGRHVIVTGWGYAAHK